MTWQSPKTNWLEGDVLTKNDFNRIEGNIAELKKAEAIEVQDVAGNFDAGNVEGALQELAGTVQDGKSAIASSLVAMNQAATSAETHAQLASKIRDISKDADAGVGNVLAGKTFYQGGEKQTGTMPNRGRAIITPGTTNKPIVQGYHDGTGYVVGDADLVAANIRKGVDIFGVTGSLAEVPWFYDFSAYTTHFDHVFQALYAGESMTFLNLTGPGWLTWLYLGMANQHECTVIIDGVTRYFNGSSSTYGPIIAQPIYFQNSVVVTIKNSGTSRIDVNLMYTYMLRNTTPDVEKHTIGDAGGVYHKGLSGTLDISGSGYLLGYGRGGSWQSSTIKIDGVTFNLRTDYWIFITGPIRFTSQVYSPSVTGSQQVLYILD